jgi:hypothetical protein
MYEENVSYCEHYSPEEVRTIWMTACVNRHIWVHPICVSLQLTSKCIRQQSYAPNFIVTSLVLGNEQGFIQFGWNYDFFNEKCRLARSWYFSFQHLLNETLIFTKHGTDVTPLANIPNSLRSGHFSQDLVWHATGKYSNLTLLDFV